ncbi:RdRP-domain-containing protein [Trametes meyenii]|nr:RdRP-domain-containing protein [Trametes meyenii]
MEIHLADLNYTATKFEVKRAFADVLHKSPFFNPNEHKARPVNFEIEFRDPDTGKSVPSTGPGSLPNNGTAVLILPYRGLGDQFFRWATRPGNRVSVQGRKLWLKISDKRPPRRLLEVLHKTPYIDPTAQEERGSRLERIRRLDVALDAIQFGVYFQCPDDPPGANRRFSNEYEIRREDTVSGRLCLDYNHKLLRIEMGNSVTDYTANHIVIDLANIKKTGYGGPNAARETYVCFELSYPPRFERQQMYRAYSGNKEKDKKGFRERLPSLDDAHECVGPFAFQLRLVLNTDNQHARRNVKHLCEEAGIRPPGKVDIDVDCCGFFLPETMGAVGAWIQHFQWPVAFQLDALLRNGLLHTGDLYDLRDDIEALHGADHEFAGDVLRHFSEKLISKQRSVTVVECFKTTLAEDRKTAESLSEGEDTELPLKTGTLKCYHAKVTPTKVLLQGPFETQSNRVVRKYHDYRENFMRVEFREETGMPLRWPKEVSGRLLIEQRFGHVLKKGLTIAGRLFRFLGYSNSGLREHTAWFMADFEHPHEGLVTPDKIRGDLGDFSKVNAIPSKYAARIAQAFSATDPSVRITRNQWDDDMEDLGTEPYWHTDGQGTISPGLRDKIWDVLVKAQPNKASLTLKPSAFQIRFLGFKGVVVVDETLEGVYMRLRPTMNKFKAHDEEEAEIEIAKAFVFPGTARLCRPLVMVLEDLGVRTDAFLRLQDRAKADVVTASDSIAKTCVLLKKHSLGNSYGLRWILQHLEGAGMQMPREKSKERTTIDNDFILRLVKYAQTHILREIKHEARIPIPDAHQLVGVVDEGPAYVNRGYKDVFCLKEGQIFACVQDPDGGEPQYVKGQVSISRNPHIHPGDVQRVHAIGKPPDDKLCFFRNLRNVVVMPSVGDRSLASCLAGGDVDGDEFLVIKDPTLLPTGCVEPASYVGVEPRRLDRPSTVDDICNFFVEYMQSDVVGLAADVHIKIADQSKDGTFDEDCMKLAQLCSQAVDYPKNGVPVDRERMPTPRISINPDWKKTEDADPRPSDYYESTRALGVLFRNFQIKPVQPPSNGEPDAPPPPRDPPLSDAISRTLRPGVERHLAHYYNADDDVDALAPLFRHYAEELRYLCLTHALSERGGVRLSEEEVAVGTILATCADSRWRKSRMHDMRLQASELVRRIKRAGLRVPAGEDAGRDELAGALRRAWLAWDYGVRNQAVFGARSFSLIALGVVCEMLERLAELEAPKESKEEKPKSG